MLSVDTKGIEERVWWSHCCCSRAPGQEKVQKVHHIVKGVGSSTHLSLSLFTADIIYTSHTSSFLWPDLTDRPMYSIKDIIPFFSIPFFLSIAPYSLLSSSFSLYLSHTLSLFITLTPIRILLSTNDKPNISSSTRVMGKAGTFMRMYLTLRNASPLYILTRRLYIHLMQLIPACWPPIVYRMLNVVLLITWNWIIAAYSAWMSTYHIARQWHISLSLVTCI